MSTDNFTSISSKGCAVVDYMCVPYSGLQFVHTFDVITMKDIIINIDYQSSEISALPDHSILCCTINMSPYYRQGIKCKTNDCSTDVNSSTPKLCSVQKNIKLKMLTQIYFLMNDALMHLSILSIRFNPALNLKMS